MICDQVIKIKDTYLQHNIINIFHQMTKTNFQIKILHFRLYNTVIHFNYAYVAPKTSWEDEIKELLATDNQVKIIWHWFKIYSAKMLYNFAFA